MSCIGCFASQLSFSLQRREHGRLEVYCHSVTAAQLLAKQREQRLAECQQQGSSVPQMGHSNSIHLLKLGPNSHQLVASH